MRAMFEREVRTSIDIDADAKSVWDALVDLDKYPDWNPMIRAASGVVAKGEYLTLRFNPPGTRPHVFKPKLIVVEPQRELRWLGIPRVPGVFDSEHYFVIDKVADDRCALAHNMLFYGLIIPPAWPFFGSKVAGYFELMNDAHKKRAESIFRREA